MRKKQKLDWEVIKELLKQGKTEDEIATQLNTGHSSINYVKKMFAEKEKKKAETAVVVFQKAEEREIKFLDTWGQLNDINESTKWVQDFVLKVIKGDKSAITLLNSDKNYKRRDPIEIFLKANDQLQNQLDFQAKLLKEIYTTQQMKEYQDLMKEIIFQEDICPHCKKKTNFRERVIEHGKKRFIFHPAMEWREK